MPPASTRSYLTLAGPAEAEIEVKRSRFVARVEPVETEDAAREVIDSVRATSREARHHCTAFVLGPDAMTRRSNDDGEPGGTAGAPILEALCAGGPEGEGLTDVVAVVTRWFGGVLLGTGGLTRAYGDATRAALEVARLRRRELRALRTLSLGHDQAARVENALRTHGVVVVDTAYAAAVTMTLAVAPGDGEERLASLVAELTGGAGSLAACGSTWVDAG